MRRTVWALGLAALALPVALRAQTATASVNASVTIAPTIAATTTSDLNFGTIPYGGSATLNVTGNAGNGQTFGVVKIDYNANVSVAVASANGDNLKNGTNSIAVTYACGYSTNSDNTTGGASSSVACNALPNLTTTAGTAATSYLKIGGSIASGANTQKPFGTYTDVLTVTVSYVP